MKYQFIMRTVFRSSLLLATACQFNPKLTDARDDIYGSRAQIFIHHNKSSFPKDYEVYVDQKRVDPESLDKNGLRLSPGKHGVDIFEKKTSKNVRHFDIEIEENRDKHFDLCAHNASSDFVLEDRDNTQRLCAPIK